MSHAIQFIVTLRGRQLFLCVKHLRACHSRSPLDTTTVIVLPDWPKFKATTKEMKLIKQFSKGEKVFMRTTPTCTYDLPNRIPTAWPINFGLIDANTPVQSPLLNTVAGSLKPNVVTIELKSEVAIKAEDESLTTTSAMVIMDPYQVDKVFFRNCL